MKKINIILVLLGLLTLSLFSSEIKVASSVDSDTIGLQDILSFKIIVSGEDGNEVSTPNLPETPGFSFRDVQSSTQSSFSWINGKTTTSFTKTFTYSLIPKEKGQHTIPPVTFNFKGSTYKTQPIQINVVDGSVNTSRSRSRRSSSIFDNFGNEPAQTQTRDGETFLVSSVDKKRVFKGEPVEVEYTLYTTENITGLQISDEKDYPGYGKDEVYSARELRMDIKPYQGQNYRAILLKRVRLMPNQSGKITVPTLELEVNVGVDFGSFWSAGTPRRKIVRNSPVNVTVDDLPDAGKPASFAGAIGKFKLEGEINRTELKAGESFQYTITLSGEGNISQFSAPDFPIIQNMRVMTPEVQNEATDSKSGKKTVKYLVIAQEKGDYTIPPIEFSYFDTSSRSYKVLRTREYNLKVTEGDSRFSASTGYVQSAVNLEGKDISYIIAKKRVPDFKPYFSTFWYWLLIIVALALVPLTYYYVREQDKLAGDADLMRQKNASRILKKYLTLATQHADKRKEEFYAAAQNGLIQYLTDKLRIAKGLTTDEILNDMKAKDTPEELVNRLSEFFRICNQARFMPGGFTGERISKDFESLKKLIQDVSRLKIKH